MKIVFIMLVVLSGCCSTSQFTVHGTITEHTESNALQQKGLDASVQFDYKF